MTIIKFNHISLTARVLHSQAHRVDVWRVRVSCELHRLLLPLKGHKAVLGLIVVLRLILKCIKGQQGTQAHGPLHLLAHAPLAADASALLGGIGCKRCMRE